MNTKSKMFALFLMTNISLISFAGQGADNSWGNWWKSKQSSFHRNQPWLGALAGFVIFAAAGYGANANSDVAVGAGLLGALSGAYMGHRGVAVTKNNIQESFEHIENESSSNKGEHRDPLIEKQKTAKKSGMTKVLSQSSMKPFGGFLFGALSGTVYGLARYGKATRYSQNHEEVLISAVTGALVGSLIGDMSKPKEA